MNIYLYTHIICSQEMCMISAPITVVAWRPPNEQQIFYRAPLYKVKAPPGEA